MIRSMTGYGDASSQSGGVHYFVEVRSLNNKYFKSTIRLAEAFQGLEAEFESRLRERLSRGTITLTARCTDASASAAYEINAAALENYMKQLRAVPGVSASIDVASLLELPGVLQPPGDEEQALERARGAFLPLLDKACAALIAMREREGKVLVDEIRMYLDFISQRMVEITARAPGIVAEYETRLRTRIEGLLRDMGASLQPVEVVREIAVYAEKTDIAEELKRLSMHVQQFHELTGGKDGRPIGRTLDFLAQEMLREANTIASKSPDANIARWIVEVKGAIDRIKEQVQNIE